MPLRPRETRPSSSKASQSPSGDDPFPYLAKLVKTPASESSENWASDLELMHHFTATTWKTLPRGPEVSEIWQLELPTMAFKHTFLAHQVLSLSANHMALLNPEQHNAYSIKASQHQSQAVQGLRKALSGLDSSLCHAVFAHASLLSINAFAILSQQMSQKKQPNLDDLLHVFLLIRGMNEILTSYENIIQQGPLSKLFQMGNYQAATPLLLEIIKDLHAILISLEVGSSMEACCKKNITTLIDWIRHARDNASLPELRVIMSWPICLTDEFVHSLREQYRPALKVMLCYCRILESTGVYNWYLRGWGRSVTEDINKLLS